MPAPGTERQERFAVEFAMNGGNAKEAAISAGYSPRSADDIGRRTAALPHVQRTVLNEFIRLCGRSGAIGLHALTEVARDAKAPASARVSAARALMEHAGLLGSVKAAPDRDEKSREDMTLDELHIEAARLYQELADHARPLNGAGVPAELRDMA